MPEFPAFLLTLDLVIIELVFRILTRNRGVMKPSSLCVSSIWIFAFHLRLSVLAVVCNFLFSELNDIYPSVVIYSNHSEVHMGFCPEFLH